VGLHAALLGATPDRTLAAWLPAWLPVAVCSSLGGQNVSGGSPLPVAVLDVA
jgi:hypothetical protein